MKRFLISLAAVISLGSLLAWGANYQVTQGSGTTFGSVVVGGVNYAQQVLCDLTTPSQCASVTAGGAITEANSAAILSAVQGSIPTGSNSIGSVFVRQISPLASQVVSGTSAISASAIAAQGTSIRFYMTDFSCSNIGASATEIFFLNGNSVGALPIWSTIAPSGGGSNKSFATPVSTTANTALVISSTVATTTLRCSVSGYAGT